MSDVRECEVPTNEFGETVVAILCSDVHLSHKCPVVRSMEDDWYEAMARPLRQLCELEQTLGAPVIVAGDLFDRWDSPAQLINFAMAELPEQVFAIPGQHDLPNHRYDSITRTAYWTLVSGHRISNLDPSKPTVIRGDTDIRAWAFPWAWEIGSADHREDDVIDLAVVHSYIWTSGKGYAGASPNHRTSSYSKRLINYDAAVFGDNHKGFSKGKIINTGTLMRRKSDEIQYNPMVGLLLADGSIVQCLLDTEDDKFIDIEEALQLVEKAVDMTDFIGALNKLQGDSLDFVSAVSEFLQRNNISTSIRKRVMEALDGRDKV